MNRFENVDVLAALEQLMRQNTAFYRNDFEIDKEIIGRAAVSDKALAAVPRETRDTVRADIMKQVLILQV